MRKVLILAAGIFLLPVLIPVARADDTYTVIIKKQEDKKRNRWSLSDWLEQRDRMQLMDLWLAIHSPTPYEFYLGGAYQVGVYGNNNVVLRAWDLEAAAFASIFGLKAARESSELDTKGLAYVQLRVLGFHDQATNLTAIGGVRWSDRNAFQFWSPMAGANLTVYFAKQFGVEFLYQHYFDSRGTSAVSTLFSGNRYEAGAFIDFAFVRVYGNYFYDLESQSAAANLTNVIRTGLRSGVRLYF